MVRSAMGLFLCVLGALASHAAAWSTPCGFVGQKCCANGQCVAGLYCDANSGNTCQYNCGGLGQYCCRNSPSGGCNDPNTFCQKGLNSEAGYNFCVENCGRLGQTCCRNKWCTGGLTCGANLKCVKCPPGPVGYVSTQCPNGNGWCGDIGNKCCQPGNTCTAGNFCDTTSEPGKRTCRPYCGAAGQRCCPVKSAGYDGCNAAEGVYCDDSVNTAGTGGTGLCTYNCGFEGQQCCPRGWCGNGLNCFQAKCVSYGGCGQPNGGCCATGTPCTKGYFCFQGMCRQNCGKEGQPCCKYDGNFCYSGLGCYNGWCQRPY